MGLTIPLFAPRLARSWWGRYSYRRVRSSDRSNSRFHGCYRFHTHHMYERDFILIHPTAPQSAPEGTNSEIKGKLWFYPSHSPSLFCILLLSELFTIVAAVALFELFPLFFRPFVPCFAASQWGGLSNSAAPPPTQLRQGR